MESKKIMLRRTVKNIKFTKIYSKIYQIVALHQSLNKQIHTINQDFIKAFTLVKGNEGTDSYTYGDSFNYGDTLLCWKSAFLLH